LICGLFNETYEAPTTISERSRMAQESKFRLKLQNLVCDTSLPRRPVRAACLPNRCKARYSWIKPDL